MSSGCRRQRNLAASASLILKGDLGQCNVHHLLKQSATWDSVDGAVDYLSVALSAMVSMFSCPLSPGNGMATRSFFLRLFDGTTQAWSQPGKRACLQLYLPLPKPSFL